MTRVFFAFVGLVVLVSFVAALANHDWFSALLLAVLGCGLPTLMRAAEHKPRKRED